MDFSIIFNMFIYLFQFSLISKLVIGVIIGLIFGIIPGLGGVIAMAVLITITYSMDTMSAFAFLIGAATAAAFGGSISAILVNIPGTSQNVATCLDGYPLTRKGEGVRALSISATSSLFGGIFGGLILFFLIPVSRQIVMAFASPEYFMLSILGLSAIAAVSGKNLSKGLIAGCLGILLSLIGYDPSTGIIRYSFGIFYLYDGINMVALLTGLFGISEMITLVVEGKKISNISISNISLNKQIWQGFKDVFYHWPLFLRSAIIGTIIGIIPGVGGSTANVVAYSNAVQTSKYPEKFGTGIIEGVIAPETSNNASFGGALLPTVTFGIPGSEMCVVLLGAFVLHGIVPGPQLMRNNIELVYLITLGVIIANIFASVGGILMVKSLIRVVSIPISLLAPIVIVVCVLGAYAASKTLEDIIVLVIIGALGYWLKKTGYPLAPLLIGFVLGNIAEINLLLALQIYGLKFFLRPISLIILIIGVFFIVVIKFGEKKQKECN